MICGYLTNPTIKTHFLFRHVLIGDSIMRFELKILSPGFCATKYNVLFVNFYSKKKNVNIIVFAILHESCEQLNKSLFCVEIKDK
jgi:hypothetical protein